MLTQYFVLKKHYPVLHVLRYMALFVLYALVWSLETISRKSDAVSLKMVSR